VRAELSDNEEKDDEESGMLVELLNELADTGNVLFVESELKFLELEESFITKNDELGKYVSELLCWVRRSGGGGSGSVKIDCQQVGSVFRGPAELERGGFFVGTAIRHEAGPTDRDRGTTDSLLTLN
jgi:hypothetical protein